MKQSIKRSSLALVALMLLALAETPPYSQGQTQNQAAESVRSRADETLEWWNQIGNKLIAMAKDFPEDKYDFKVSGAANLSFPSHILTKAVLETGAPLTHFTLDLLASCGKLWRCVVSRERICCP